MDFSFPLEFSHIRWVVCSIGDRSLHYFFPVLRRYSLNKILNCFTFINILTIVVLFSTTGSQSVRWMYHLPKISEAWVRLDMFATSGYFLIGMISYRAFKAHQTGTSLSVIHKKLNIKSGSLILYLTTFLFVPLNFGTQLESLGYLCLMIIMSVGVANSTRSTKLFASIGRYSYFIYFCHFQVLFFVEILLKRNTFTMRSVIDQPLIDYSHRKR